MEPGFENRSSSDSIRVANLIVSRGRRVHHLAHSDR